MEAYAEQLLAPLYNLMATGNPRVLQHAMTAVASIASNIKSKFVPYYSTFVPILKVCLILKVTYHPRK